MPFKSKSQQRWMYANKPEMAKKWSDHTSDHKSLPEKAKKKKKRKEKKAALIALRKTAAMSNPLTSYEAPGGLEEWHSWPSVGGSLGAGLVGHSANELYIKNMLPQFKGVDVDSAVKIAPEGGKWRVSSPRGGARGKYHYERLKNHKPVESLLDLLKVYSSKGGRALPTVHLNPLVGAAEVMKGLKPLPVRARGGIEAKFRKVVQKVLERLPGYYEAKSNIIGMQPQMARDPHILAHELGHATQRKFLTSPLRKPLSFGGKGVAIGGGLGVLGTDDSAKAKQYALLSNAGALPLLGLEAHASGKGSQLMRELAQQKGTWDKLKGLSKLKYRMGAWKGFPTYAMAGIGVPWLTYAIKKSLGGYGKPKA